MSLTKYPEGSLRELWNIAVPLMLSSLSVMLMLFIDRLLLAHYSLSALNAAVNATTFGWAFVFGWMVLTSISEVFVAQYNGAGHRERLGEPVWQMIWLSLLSIPFFYYMAYWGMQLYYGQADAHPMEQEYFYWMMIFGPSFPLYAALCGFFVGQGKVKVITYLAIVANIINAGLDYILIFGIEGVISPWGVKGAAIATSGSGIFQVLVLSVIFLSEKNRRDLGTTHCAFNLKLFGQCLKIGLPGAIFVAIELLGWASFYHMMSLVGEKYITIAGICQSIAFLFYFFIEGISKAATTIAGNLIGAKRRWYISKMLVSGVILLLGFLFAMLASLFYGSVFLMNLFLPDANPDLLLQIYDSLLISLYFIVIYVFFEGIRLLFSGVLTAAGDTVFLLIAGTLSIWFLLVLPVYYFIVMHHYSIEFAMFICVAYSIGACLIYLWRYTQGAWKKKAITI